MGIQPTKAVAEPQGHPCYQHFKLTCSILHVTGLLLFRDVLWDVSLVLRSYSANLAVPTSFSPAGMFPMVRIPFLPTPQATDTRPMMQAVSGPRGRVHLSGRGGCGKIRRCGLGKARECHILPCCHQHKGLGFEVLESVCV